MSTLSEFFRPLVSLRAAKLLIAPLLLAGAFLTACGSDGSGDALRPTVIVGPGRTTGATPGSGETPEPGSESATAGPSDDIIPPGAGSRVEWRGEEWYLHGVNLPWYNWSCDFGCNGNGGASSADVQAALAPRFAELQDAGVHNVRWWLFPGDPWQITRDSSGAPTGIDPAVYADIDAALALAEKYDLYYTFALFSAPTHLPPAWLSDDAQRDKLVAVLGELFAKYAGNPHILAWDVINEPEFDIWSGEADGEDLQALVRDVAAEVHERSDGALVTVGGAMLDGLSFWVGLGLDFYSPHWYDYMAMGDWCARCTTYEALREKYNLDAPVVIGELYTGSDTDSAARFADFYDKGFAGAWAWSLFPEKTEDRLDIDLDAAARFAESSAENGPKDLP